MNPIKWQKEAPQKALKCHYLASRSSKLERAQDSELASKGLTYEKTHTVDTVQLGVQQDRELAEYISKFPKLKVWEKARIDAGMPEELAKECTRAIIDSANVNAGINEAVRTYAVKKHGLSPTFWKSGESTPSKDISGELMDL